MRVRRKSAVVDAAQFDGSRRGFDALLEGLELTLEQVWFRQDSKDPERGWIACRTAEGSTIAPAGYWIVKDERGGVSTCHPEVFSQAFEEKDDEQEFDPTKLALKQALVREHAYFETLKAARIRNDELVEENRRLRAQLGSNCVADHEQRALSQGIARERLGRE